MPDPICTCDQFATDAPPPNCPAHGVTDGAVRRQVCTCQPDHPCYLHAGDDGDPAERLRKVTAALEAAQDAATPEELARAASIGELLGRPGAIVVGQADLERLRAALGEHDGAMYPGGVSRPVDPDPFRWAKHVDISRPDELTDWRTTYGRLGGDPNVDLSLPPLPSRATVLGLLGAIAGVILAGRRLRKARRRALPPGATVLADLIGTGK